VYNNFLAPLFAEHEPAIDEFIGGVRGQAGAHARGGLGWLYERIRTMLGVSSKIQAGADASSRRSRRATSARRGSSSSASSSGSRARSLPRLVFRPLRPSRRP
jgi:hypothetical protein